MGGKFIKIEGWCLQFTNIPTTMTVFWYSIYIQILLVVIKHQLVSTILLLVKTSGFMWSHKLVENCKYNLCISRTFVLCYSLKGDTTGTDLMAVQSCDTSISRHNVAVELCYVANASFAQVFLILLTSEFPWKNTWVEMVLWLKIIGSKWCSKVFIYLVKNKVLNCSAFLVPA